LDLEGSKPQDQGLYHMGQPFGVSREVVGNVWGCSHVDWVYLGSKGASGGMLLMWDRRVV
jgi:hypothetical protein